MKKFFLYVGLVLVVLGALLAYILYSEGVFDTIEYTKEGEMMMKCEAGKCAAGKCAGGK